MKEGRKEFHDMREQFEKDISKISGYIGGKIQREDRRETTPKDVWYTNGVVNGLFIAYMLGYQNARNIYMDACLY